MLSGLLSLWLAAAPAPDGARALSSLVRELELTRCEEAFALLPLAKAPERPSPDSRAAARSIARAASRCGTDPALAVAFTELAVRLAPDEPEVQVEHAQNLVALDQRAEAASLLDRLLEAHPGEVPLARLVRGQLAADEGEHELALRILAPLADHPTYRAEVAPLMEASRRALDERERRAREETERVLARRVDGALREALRPSQESGKVVASFSEIVSLGEEQTFTATGLHPSQLYVLRAYGFCENEAERACDLRAARFIPERRAPIAGVDFSVQFGGQEPRPLVAGVDGPERNELSFVADSEEMEIRVFGQSAVDEGVRCTFSGFVVFVP